MTDRTILITGATGQQGGATARALLQSKQPWRLRALVRKPDSEAAKRLAASGVEIVGGDLNDESSVRQALEGVYGVYSVQTPMQGGPEAEERQGKMLADAAKAARVQHFVYSSVAGAERHSGIPHFESKGRVERHIDGLGLPATILRPVLFMDNFGPVSFRMIMLIMLKTFVAEARKVQMVATRDIGRLAAEALEQPERTIGQAIELAGDAVTRGELVEALRANGRRPAFSFRVPGWLQGKIPEEYKLMMRWIGGDGFQADVPALRREHPGLLTVRQWAAQSAAEATGTSDVRTTRPAALVGTAT